MLPDASAPVLHHEKRSCRRCKGRLQRISRALIVKLLLFWLPLKRYKCLRCGKKVYMWV